LPKDAHTLLKTPRHVQGIEGKCGGAYKYFGVEDGLLKLIEYMPHMLLAMK